MKHNYVYAIPGESGLELFNSDGAKAEFGMCNGGFVKEITQRPKEAHKVVVVYPLRFCKDEQEVAERVSANKLTT